jgi:hypothetical protein
MLKNHAFVLEPSHIIPGVTKFQEYFLCVLPQFGSQRPNSGWCLAELDRAIHYFELHARLVFHFREEAILPRLGITCYLQWSLDTPQN